MKADTDESLSSLSPTESPVRTVADLVALLRSLPTPGLAFWDDVEAATRQYPKLLSSPWEH